jgi:tetratricopeptide (TPR) repeat protein
MDALVRALEHDPARIFRRTAAAVGSLALAGFAVLAYSHWRDAPGARCRGSEEKLAGVWDAPRRDAARAAFLATGKPFAAAAWRQAEHLLDVYARDWSRMRTQACEATWVSGEQSAHLLDLRMRCLAHRRDELGALVLRFTSADATVVPRAAQAVHSLRRVRDCADTAALQAIVPLPAEQHVRRAIEELRRRIAHTRALKHAGRYHDGEREAAAIVGAAHALRYRPLEAEAHALHGDFLISNGRHGQAVTAWRNAIRAADAGRDAKLAALGWAELAWSLSYLGRNELSLALEYVQHAAAIAEGIGGDLELEGIIAKSYGGLLLDLRRHDEAFRAFETAARRLESAYGRDHPGVATALVNLGVAASKLNRSADALKHFREALVVQERALGSHHPLVGHTLFNLAAESATAAMYDQARAYAERSLRILDAALGPEHPFIASALHARARVALGQRHFGEAQRFAERAVAMGAMTRPAGDSMNAQYLETLGDAFRGLRRFPEALAAYKRALEMHLRREGEKADALRVYGTIGAVHLASGAPAKAARWLRRAVGVRVPKGEEASMAAARFALARAEWRAGGDRGRSRRLAEEALAFFRAAGPSLAKELAEVRDWLFRR